MNLLRYIRFAALLAALSIATPAQAVRVTAGAGSGQAGQTVDIPITTTTLTGAGVVAYQFEVTYNSSVIHATDVLEAGTLSGTAGWGDAVFQVTENASAGRIRISHAGISSLSGAGELLRLRFVVDPAQLGASGTSLTMPSTEFVFNEGAPLDTTVNGFLTVLATPQITVSPASGEIIRGQTLAFTVSANASLPVTWSTTNAAVATIGSGGLLTGVAPGSVRVFAVDAAGRRDTTDGEILVRGMGMTAGSQSVPIGNIVDVPITVTSLTGLGIRAGQFRLSYNAAIATATAVIAGPGTLLSGYGPVGFGTMPGACAVDFAGASDLNGAGVLCYVRFQGSAVQSGSTALTLSNALFNEVLPPRITNGTLTVSSLPTITVAPDNVTLLAGDLRTFTVSGAATPPLTWSTLDPSVASISPGGVLTALAGGTTQVRAVDAIGATDLNSFVRVHDLRVALDTVTCLPGSQVLLALEADRNVGGLGVYSAEYRVQWNSPHVTAVSPWNGGLVPGTWSAGSILTVAGSQSIAVTGAGAVPLGPGGVTLHGLNVTLSPTTPPNIDIPFTITRMLFNEGAPDAQIGAGLIRVRSVTDAPLGSPLALALHSPSPNPSRGGTMFLFALPGGGEAASPATLELVGVDGRRVRTLLSATLPPGEHRARWNGQDDGGRLVPPGLYLARLTTPSGQRTTKVMVTR